MAEHTKSKSKRGFNRPDGSPCRPCILAILFKLDSDLFRAIYYSPCTTTSLPLLLALLGGVFALPLPLDGGG